MKQTKPTFLQRVKIRAFVFSLDCLIRWYIRTNTGLDRKSLKMIEDSWLPSYRVDVSQALQRTAVLAKFSADYLNKWKDEPKVDSVVAHSLRIKEKKDTLEAEIAIKNREAEFKAHRLGLRRADENYWQDLAVKERVLSAVGV